MFDGLHCKTTSVDLQEDSYGTERVVQSLAFFEIVRLESLKTF